MSTTRPPQFYTHEYHLTWKSREFKRITIFGKVCIWLWSIQRLQKTSSNSMFASTFIAFRCRGLQFDIHYPLFTTLSCCYLSSVARMHEVATPKRNIVNFVRVCLQILRVVHLSLRSMQGDEVRVKVSKQDAQRTGYVVCKMLSVVSNILRPHNAAEVLALALRHSSSNTER